MQNNYIIFLPEFQLLKSFQPHSNTLKIMARSLLFFIFFANVAFGQEPSTTRNNEFYLTLADFSPLNVHLKYKKQIGARTYLKFGLVNLSASRTEFIPNGGAVSTRTTYSGGLEIGIEFRKELTEKLTFFHGPNIRYSYQATIEKMNVPITDDKTTTDVHIASIPYSIGVLFNLTPKLLLAAEINPSVNFGQTQVRNTSGSLTYTGTTTTNFNFAFDNRFGLLSLVFRI